MYVRIMYVRIIAASMSPSKQSSPSFVDVFCGAGGFTAGACKAGWRHVLGIDIDPHACATYAANHDGRVHKGDVRALTDKQLRALAGPVDVSVDVILGSPPCQSISLAGPTSNLHHDNDTLYLEVLRLARVFRARAIVLENVAHMATKGTILKDLYALLHRAGFDAWHAVLSAEKFQVPQRRKRLFVVALRRTSGGGGAAAFQWPAEVSGFDASFARIMQSDREVDAARVRYKYDVWLSDKKRAAYIARKLNPATAAYVRFVDPTLVALTARAGYHKSRGAESLVLRAAGAKGRTGRVLTSVASVRDAAGTRMRMLTIDEFKAIQTFPESYTFAGPVGAIYKQIGNSVPVNMAYHLCRQVGGHVRSV